MSHTQEGTLNNALHSAYFVRQELLVQRFAKGFTSSRTMRLLRSWPRPAVRSAKPKARARATRRLSPPLSCLMDRSFNPPSLCTCTLCTGQHIFFVSPAITLAVQTWLCDPDSCCHPGCTHVSAQLSPASCVACRQCSWRITVSCPAR